MTHRPPEPLACAPFSSSRSCSPASRIRRGCGCALVAAPVDSARRRCSRSRTSRVRRQQDGARIRRDGSRGGRVRVLGAVGCRCRAAAPSVASSLWALSIAGVRSARRVGGTRLHARRAAEFVRQATARRRAGQGTARSDRRRCLVRRRSRRFDHRNVDRDLARRSDAVADVGRTCMLIGPAIHLAFSVLLYRLGVKARAA